MTNLLLLTSPFRLSIWELQPVREAVARPIPAVVCAAAGLFLAQGFRYLAKARKECQHGDTSRGKVSLLRGSMILAFILAAPRIAVLGLELRYPDRPATQVQDMNP